MLEGKRIVLGVSGGIAAYKAVEVCRRLVDAGAHVIPVLTDGALHFIGRTTFDALGSERAWTSLWDEPHPIPHTHLGQTADLVLVAPATARVIGLLAAGISDDLLLNVLIATRAPVVVCPAMHTEMWESPAVQANVATLRSRGVTIVEPGEGHLAGGDVGMGRLAEPADIVAACAAVLATTQDLAGLRVLVTAGGTREPIDPVRFVGNRSSGKQGHALADEAAARGAAVTLVTTTNRPTAPGVEVVRVETAEEMEQAVTTRADASDVVVMAAAVADFRPARYAGTKIKKTHAAGSDGAADESAPSVELVRNPDVLAGLVAARGGARSPVIVGFAAETGDAEGSVLDHAREKLARKGCDLLVVNEVGTDTTFGHDDSTVHLLRPGSDAATRVGPAPKLVVAHAVWDAVLPLL
jgi:phosphopantothenoylcysteine decarboxylase / phosphopantothenate---cysteine ligase